MSDTEGKYKGLGRQLKALRSRAHESLAEAAGAVEIDVKQLASFELGKARPSEDVLLLLLTHLSAKDDEAVRTWELAGYGSEATAHIHQTVDTASADNQILFTDVVDVTVNNYGVVMNFMQGTGQNSPASTVARVGMSREHAKSVLQILQLTLSQTEKQINDITPRKINSQDNLADKN
jgi:transcriptional regulator with XRE-family HTH domain